MGWKKELKRMLGSLEGQGLAKSAAPLPAALSDRALQPGEADANELRRRDTERESALSLIKQAQLQPSFADDSAAFSAIFEPKVAKKLAKLAAKRAAEDRAIEASTMETSVGGRMLKGDSRHVDRVDRLIRTQALEQDVAAKREILAQAQRGGSAVHIEKAEGELRAKQDELSKLQASAPSMSPAIAQSGDEVTKAKLKKLKKKMKAKSKLKKLRKRYKALKKFVKSADAELAKRAAAAGSTADSK